MGKHDSSPALIAMVLVNTMHCTSRVPSKYCSLQQSNGTLSAGTKRFREWVYLSYLFSLTCGSVRTVLHGEKRHTQRNLSSGYLK